MKIIILANVVSLSMTAIMVVIVAAILICIIINIPKRERIALEWCFRQTRSMLSATLESIENMTQPNANGTPCVFDIKFFNRIQGLAFDTLNEGLLWNTQGNEANLCLKSDRIPAPDVIIGCSDYAYCQNTDLLAWLHDVIHLFSVFASERVNEGQFTTPREFDSDGKAVPAGNPYKKRINTLLDDIRRLLGEYPSPPPPVGKIG